MEEIEDVKIAVVGNVNASKSTLIGTLLSGTNDNGRGANRELVMNYKHEKDSGQTSSIGYQILGFRKDGSIIHIENRSKKETWPKIIKETKKLISFMDLAGHEKYLKTTIHGMSCNHPDYALILVEGKGVRGMTREHIMLALSFEVPFIILITKIDLYGKESVAATIEHIGKIIKSAKQDMWVIREKIDMEIPLQKSGEKFVPVFKISNVTGEGLDLFKDYLYRLPKRIDYSMYRDEPFELAVIEGFVVTGVGTVAHGFLARGTLRKDDSVWVGPDSTGNYHKSKVRSIHFKRLPVEFALPGHLVCVNLPNIERKLLKQGVYVLHDKVANRMAIRKFTADVKVLTTHPITITKGYCPILNMDNIRMAARVLKITAIPTEKESNPEIIKECLRGGGKARIQFKFTYYPAYMRPNANFVFREGKTRGFGKVISIDLEMANGGVKQKFRKR
jgi:GTPase